MDRFRTSMQLREQLVSKYMGYDDRTKLLTLASVNYYTVPEKEKDTAAVPYGFTEIEKTDGLAYQLYENQYALPLGYFYDKIVPCEIWEALSPLQKQNVMLEAACVRETSIAADVPSLDEFGSDNVQLIPAEPVFSHGLEAVDGKTYQADTENAVLTLNLTAYVLPVSELYVELSVRDYEGAAGETQADIIITSSSGVSKTLSYYTEDYDFYSGRHDFVVDLGCYETLPAEITLTFQTPGTYFLDALYVYADTFEGYEEKIEHLKRNSLQQVAFGADELTGNLICDSPGILCVTVPYSEGWTAYVDGKAADVCCVNEHYLGLYAETGSHEIRLVYKRPHQTLGIIISFIGILLFIGLGVIRKAGKKDA